MPDQEAATDGLAVHHDRIALLRETLRAPGRYMEPWYLAYLLLGAVTAGLVPILLPLMIVAVSHKLSTVAYVMGVFNLGLLTSPAWGLLAERGRLYRGVFFGGFVAVLSGLIVMPLVASAGPWMVLAFVIGAGTAAAATVASLFVLDFAPRTEWEPRIGWLQSFNGAGQVVGLLLAGVFSHGHYAAGLWVAALLLAPALYLGGRGLPIARERRAGRERDPHLHLNVRALAGVPRANLPGGGLLHHSHHINLAALRSIRGLLGTPFGRFLGSWFALSMGVAGFFTYFPLLMRSSYGVAPSWTSLTYALAAGVGIALFILSSRWAARSGAAHVYLAGVALRLAGFGLLLALFLVPAGAKAGLSLAGFAAIMLAWPILSVSGTDLAARLAPMGEGAAMGLFNASQALATVLGTFAAGPLVHVFGYGVIPVLALAGLLAAGALARGLGDAGTVPDDPHGTRTGQ
ncbi:MAG: MFS transporter [Gammaproteobacteria bacterium]|nr:MFS transporter [Gammaproteobacteria bacterium]